jgi:hypothetical protein
MGSIFSSGPMTIVSSTVYNLAGDVNKRANYLKTTVISNVVGDSTMTMGETISNAYLHGPGMKLRSFARWADGSADYNDVIGNASGVITTGNSLNTEQLAAQIPHDAGYTVALQQTSLGPADSSWWADQYIAQNHPALLTTDWHSDYDVPSNTITITFADHSTETFNPVGLDSRANYIYAAYILTTGQAGGPVVPGTPALLGSLDPFPDLTGWTADSDVSTPMPVTLNTVVKTVTSYSDGRPDETATTTTPAADAYTEVHRVYEKSQFKGIDPANKTRTYSIRSIQHQDQTGAVVAGTPTVTVTHDTITGGVTRTKTVTTTVDTIVLSRSYRTDTQDVTNNTFSAVKVFIYQYATGNPVLDGMFNVPSSMGSFYPYIPIRLNNQFVSDSYLPDVYAIAKKAYKKSVGGQLDDTIAQIADNASIGDIDYAYAVFGVSLNVAEVKCKKYIYTFFKTIMESASFDTHAYDAWKLEWQAAKDSWTAYEAWLRANWGTGTDNIATMPEILPYPDLSQQSVHVFVPNNSPMNYFIQLSWAGVNETTGAGMRSPDHKVGDMWWEINATESFHQTTAYVGDSDIITYDDVINVESVTLYSQVSANNWTAITLHGLVHRNMIYGGNSVFTSAVDALNDTEESGFIIPLHEDIYRSTSLVDATQMATACCYLVFNCYKVVKKKWYQTGLFTVIIIIIIIIITWFTWGSGTGPASAGLLGTNAAVGAALGFTGTMAIVVGAIANALAAMVLMKLIGVASNLIFGEKVGAIVGAIASVIAIAYGTAMSNGAQFSLADMGSAANILQLTSAVGNGYVGYMNKETQDIVADTQQTLADYNTQAQGISDQWAKMFGTDLGQLDAFSLFTDAGSTSTTTNFIPESRDSFLGRTLMCGSDVVELSHALVYNFTDITLNADMSSS